MDSGYVLEMEHISKEYYGNPVLKDVSLAIKPGEILALMGENGAGKSTLMNILFGMPVIQSTGGFEGKVRIDGEDVVLDTPHKAMDAGIGMVHQEFMLIPGFTITENIKLGREISRSNIFSTVFGKALETLDTEQMAKDARKALDEIGMDIDEYTRVAGLPVGYMQFIEIAREIDKENIRLLVFDEPTAVLAESEADRLLDVMRHLASRGIAIVFITHRLDEIMRVADSVTILRDGEGIATKKIAETTEAEIAELMIGRKVEKIVSAASDRKIDASDVVLEVKDLQVDMPGERVRGVSFSVSRGEIFGIGGLAGQGKVGIPNGIRGLYPAKGDVIAFGEKINLSRGGDALHKKIAFVSEDRRGVGLLLNDSIEENVCFSAIEVNRKYVTNIGIAKLRSTTKVRNQANKMIKLLDIRCRGPRQRTGSLSGGNQQKVCLANALTLDPQLLIVSEPTRGIDIGAKKLVLEYLVKLSQEVGMTVIIVSSELNELRSICDRIAIVTDGKINQILSPTAAEAEFGLAMSGSSKKGGADA